MRRQQCNLMDLLCARDLSPSDKRTGTTWENTNPPKDPRRCPRKPFLVQSHNHPPYNFLQLSTVYVRSWLQILTRLDLKEWMKLVQID